MKRAKVAPAAGRPGVLALLNPIGASTAYRRKQTVFVQGDPSDALFYLQRGEVTLSVMSARGKSAIVAVLEAGQCFGEGCLVGEPRRLATAHATADSAIVRVTKARGTT